MNFGTEEYAYFQYIQDTYNYLPSFVSFVQGGGLSENTHLVYDLMGKEIPGLTYKSLTRFNTDAWHMFGKDLNAEDGKKTKEAELMDSYFPYLKNQYTWWTNWRGMFTVSRSRIKHNSWISYASINVEISGRKCGSQNCNIEPLFVSFCGCNTELYLGKSGCTTGVYTNLSYPVIEEDYLKDGCSQSSCSNNNTLPAMDTEWIICGSKTMMFSRSILNGALICLESANGTTHETNRQYLSDYIRGDTSWNTTFSNVTWNLGPQWAKLDEYKWT